MVSAFGENATDGASRGDERECSLQVWAMAWPDTGGEPSSGLLDGRGVITIVINGTA